MSGIIVSGDTSGSVTLSAPAVAGTVTVTLPSTTGTMLTTASATGISGSAISSGTVPEAYGGTGTSTGYYGFKNRIINGAMVIDQRNAGASVTVNSNSQYFYDVDRFYGIGQSTDGVFTLQQNTSVPTGQGFVNSMKVTITTADASIGATQYYWIGQAVEGYNVADLQYGTANAKTVTLSFWVNCSVTGTFSGCFMNSASDRSYPFTYTISTANTWEQKTITIAGDTTGTWLTTNGIGISVQWSLGSGSSRSGTANTWAAARYHGATGATALISTLSATLYITGVQLEKGSTATSFDYRPYGSELQLCQRYCYSDNSSLNANTQFGSGYINSATLGLAVIKFPVTLRASPTFTASGSFQFNTPATAFPITALTQNQSGINLSLLQGTMTLGTANIPANLGSAGVTTAIFTFSAEL